MTLKILQASAAYVTFKKPIKIIGKPIELAYGYMVMVAATGLEQLYKLRGREKGI